MTGNELFMEDFFAKKNTMNFLGIPTMSLGEVEPSGEGFDIEIEKEDMYRIDSMQPAGWSGEHPDFPRVK